MITNWLPEAASSYAADLDWLLVFITVIVGVWFIAVALGNLFAGLVAGSLQILPPDRLFWSVALFTGGVGALALVASPGIGRLMGTGD